MQVTQEILGFSHEKREILLFKAGNGSKRILWIAGVHGDEIEGWDLSQRIFHELKNNLWSLDPIVSLYFCPQVNPDGCADLRRTNFRNVDLNRNMPTQNWAPGFKNPRMYPGQSAGSEPETQAVMQMVEQIQPALILSMHSYEKPMVNFDGEFTRSAAEFLAKEVGLEAKNDMGYPTPGSLGNYAALERKIPTITLEILRGQVLNHVYEQHAPGLRKILNGAGF